VYESLDSDRVPKYWRENYIFVPVHWKYRKDIGFCVLDPKIEFTSIVSEKRKGISSAVSEPKYDFLPIRVQKRKSSKKIN
jgi:hypothetical protein